MAALALEQVYLHTLFDKTSCQIISELRKISFDENGENVTKLETKDDSMSQVIINLPEINSIMEVQALDKDITHYLGI